MGRSSSKHSKPLHAREEATEEEVLPAELSDSSEPSEPPEEEDPSDPPDEELPGPAEEELLPGSPELAEEDDPPA